MSEVLIASNLPVPPRNSQLIGIALGVCGASLAVALAYEPLLIFAIVLAGSLVGTALKQPVITLKLMLLYGGIPLELLGNNGDLATKPLFRDLGGTTVDGLVLVVMSFTLVVVLFNSRAFRIPKHLVPYAALVIFAAFTLLYSIARLDGLRLVLKLAYPIFIFLLALRFLDTEAQVKSALRYWIAGGILATIGGAAAFVVMGIQFFIYNGDIRYSSGLIYYNAFSIYMFTLFTLCYALWRNGRGRGYGALALLFGLQGFASETRITWLALFVAVLLIEATQKARQLKIMRIIGVACLLIASASYVVLQSRELQIRIFRSELDSHASATDTAGHLDLSSRGLVWALIFADYWTHDLWIGQGAGSSLPVLREKFPPEVAAPHNEYLRMLHDAGMVGLLLFVAALIALFLWVRKLLVDCKDHRQRLFARIAMALLTGYAIIAVTDNPFDYYLVFSQYVFFALALAAGASRWKSYDLEGNAVGDNTLRFA